MHGKTAAVNAIGKAAASGAVSREMHDINGTPDFEVHHETVVDHRGHPFLPPAVVGQHTSVIENTPKSATVSNDNKASVVLGFEPKTVVSNGGSKQILHKSAGAHAPVTYSQADSEKSVSEDADVNQHQTKTVNNILGNLVDAEESIKNEEPYQLMSQISKPVVRQEDSYQATVVSPEMRTMFHQKYIDNMLKKLDEKDEIIDKK